MAIFMLPSLNSNILPSLLLVPSGNTNIETPFLTLSIQLIIDLSPCLTSFLSRNTQRIAFISCAKIGIFENSIFARYPVAISNTDAVFEKHIPMIKGAPVIIEFGEPIYMKDVDKERQKFLGKEVLEIIIKMKEVNDKELSEI